MAASDVAFGMTAAMQAVLAVAWFLGARVADVQRAAALYRAAFALASAISFVLLILARQTLRRQRYGDVRAPVGLAQQLAPDPFRTSAIEAVPLGGNALHQIDMSRDTRYDSCRPTGSR